MRQLLISFSLVTLLLSACKLMPKEQTPAENNRDLSKLFDDYYEGRMAMFPVEATFNGDDRYNDRLPVDFADAFRDSTRSFYAHCLQRLRQFDKASLNANDRLSYDILNWELDSRLDGFRFHSNYIPFNQFTGLPLILGQMGSGASVQPFRTIGDHERWIRRAKAFGPWADSAIVYFRKGLDSNIVLPRSLVLKLIPELEAIANGGLETNLFYGPVKQLAKETDTAAARRLVGEYQDLIRGTIIPSYKRLADFLKKDYLPKARSSSGLSALPGGPAWYEWLVHDQTTTSKTPEEIYQTGLSEVARIRRIMDSVKSSVGFTGDLHAFFDYINTDKKFKPYKTPQEVLDAFEAIHQRMQPKLRELFDHVPKTRFEIRQTEAFRAASASAEYFQGSPDGRRPGVFYVPILDATQFNMASGMESLFLHEAIPGHHYQISLQQEDTLLPRFRRFGGNNAYVEGWALYCESLGRELGLYTDPYQYMGALGDEIHRAIRLVVDVAIHTRGMSREAAIKYMTDNEQISEEGATAEIERYMAIPGQALGYKIGALKIRELRNKAQQTLGDKFHIAAFHDAVLDDGAMPLDVLEKKIDAWIEARK
ncbi:MAG: DUF885 domain-containing protein [Bacteroidota bacterium]|nr:DUF885 domain-containing protein [Bacteroidota bacterium]